MSAPKKEEHIYYNVTIDGSGLSKLAKFQEERVQPILDCPSDYHVTIERFSVPGSEIPILICPIQDIRGGSGIVNVPNNPIGRVTIFSTNNLQPSDTVVLSGTSIDGIYNVIQSTPSTFSIDITIPSTVSIGTYTKQQDPNLTTLSITLQQGLDVVQQYLRFNGSPGFAPAAINGVYPRTPYYFIYSYQRLINMINEAFIEAHNNLLVSTGVPPYITFDNEKLSYNLQRSTYLSTIQIYLSSSISRYLDSFNYDLTELDNGRHLQLIVTDVPSDYYQPLNLAPAVPGTYYRIEQEYSSIYLWNSFQNLVFMSQSLPIFYENVKSNAEGLVNFAPILTDFAPLFTSPGDSRSNLSYTPLGPYRLIDMNSTVPLRRIDIQVFWRDELDNLYPVQIREGQQVSIKLLFIRKK